MKKLLITSVIGALLFITVTANAQQTREERKALKQARKELAQLNAQLRYLTARSSTFTPDTAGFYAQKLRLEADLASNLGTFGQRDEYKKQLAEINKVLSEARATPKYAGNRNDTLIRDLHFRITQLELATQKFSVKRLNNAYDDVIPREMSRLEAKQRKQSNELRREEADLTKLYAMQADKDPVMGYLGLIYNPTKHTVAHFYVYDAEGRRVDGASCRLEPGQYREIYLLPGEYIGKIYVRGEPAGCDRISSGASRNSYIMGKNYHWHLYLNKEV
ncbi:hypothetical protein CVU83_00435 [Candidatus Falkowbacteria bacterium HGW-Falkowbacteria-2]|uniref:Uncharacterized protein n=1 Tax=Candidatus Falkowbacteria bacterium HGW-Falkowbacteria-2 TaxID=2013769 RepID=A0A2N2E3G6_9BACT|nr:MAG: hypothetical protein CVU83_00435 [Candidatus Falkowbacteria bacterium HGW-Falkowbacteria-2]